MWAVTICLLWCDDEWCLVLTSFELVLLVPVWNWKKMCFTRINRVCPEGSLFIVFTSASTFKNIPSLYGFLFLVLKGLLNWTGSCYPVWPVSVTCFLLFIIVVSALNWKEIFILKSKSFSFILVVSLEQRKTFEKMVSFIFLNNLICFWRCITVLTNFKCLICQC